jgi:poly(ADP-ribose) glycohydrolase
MQKRSLGLGSLSKHAAAPDDLDSNFDRLISFKRHFKPEADVRRFLIEVTGARASGQDERERKKLSEFRVHNQGAIEDCPNTWQIDFANQYIGGGVMNHGCCQEEIRFIMSPECLLSTYFTQVLGPNECVVITGTERFNKVKGYARSLQFDGHYIDNTLLDNTGKIASCIVAIDALSFHPAHSQSQFEEKNVVRELVKAHVGFSIPMDSHIKLPLKKSFHSQPLLPFSSSSLSSSVSASSSSESKHSDADLQNQFRFETIATGNWG